MQLEYDVISFQLSILILGQEKNVLPITAWAFGEGYLLLMLPWEYQYNDN